MTTKLTKLKLHNIGGFKDFELNFHDKLTVLIGENGTGKTTILSNIALILNFLFDHLNGKKVSFGRLIEYKSSNIDCDINLDSKSFLLGLNNFELNGIDSFATTIKQLFNEYRYLPLFVYYPTYQTPLEKIVFSYVNIEDNPSEAYMSACNNEVFDVNRFFAWFKWQEGIKREVGNNKKYEIIRQAVCQVLTDNKTTFDNLYITWLKNPQGDLCIEKNGTVLNINQLSAGERMLMILVADLARRLIVANPKSDNPLHGDGVVLIDEIDLHLHPSWQRKIVPNLMEIFPNCQFIISTHSPLILSNISHNNIIILEDFQAVKVTPHTLGRDNNSILYDLMGVKQRPEQTQQKLDKLYKLIDDGNEFEAQNLLEKLSEDLGENDIAIVQARVSLDFMNIDDETN